VAAATIVLRVAGAATGVFAAAYYPLRTRTARGGDAAAAAAAADCNVPQAATTWTSAAGAAAKVASLRTPAA